MDRVQVYRGQIPYESDVLGMQQDAYMGLSWLAMDVLGSATVVGGLACNPTTPASLSVTVGPGRIYTKAVLDQNPIGQIGGTGGLPADTNSDHQILKQGALTDTQTFAITAPGVSGQSQVYLIQAQLQEIDDPSTTLQFYNTTNPSAPISQSLSPARRDKCVLQLKAGTAATTGTQVAPTSDAGWTPLWAITVANGQTTITLTSISAATGAPFITALGGLPGKAPAADIQAGVRDDEYITPLQLKNAMLPQILTDAATVAFDQSKGFRARLTMTPAVGNTRVLGVPTNLQDGATGSIQLKQPATGGPCSVTFNACWDFGSLGAPTSFSTAANKTDMLYYEVIDAATPVLKCSFSKAG